MTSGAIPIVAVQAWAVTVGAAVLRHWPIWGMAAAWTLVASAPRIALQMGDVLYERHIYTPMIAWCLVAGAALFPRKDVLCDARL